MKTQTLALASVAVVLGATSSLAQTNTGQTSTIQTVIGQMNSADANTAQVGTAQTVTVQPNIAQTTAPNTAQTPSYQMQETVVTATGRPEEVAKIAGTIQVIPQERIAHSSAKSVTDLLAENAVGFMSEWTAGQTSINIRGASTDGQGRDFKSQVLVLINGHRAGTANVSKLSPADVERIEIVRGPSSVVYGSQNMGGVINIILKTGLTAPGTLLEASTGSWLLAQGRAQTGGTSGKYDWYVGTEGGSRGDYNRSGNVTEQNTHWTRYGGTGSFGLQIDDNQHVNLTVRSDGIYNAGFRGSASNVYDFDNRYNQSIDLTYNGKTPDGRGSLMFQGYYVRDVDDLNQQVPLSAANAFGARSYVDRNRRQLDIVGTRFQPGFKPWSTNELLFGIDYEHSTVRSDRYRLTNLPANQLSPADNNQTENVFGFYVEDAQHFWDDRITVRGGVRQTYGNTAIDWTPNAPTLLSGANNYQATTWSVGATLAATDWLNLRAGASTGFRAPTGTELGANFTVAPIGTTTTFGNPNLKPETATQMELGGTANWNGGRFDLALFQNIINNRITPVTVSQVGTTIIAQQQNNPGNIVVQGLEIQNDTSVIRTLGLKVPETWNWNVFGNGYYNFKMIDYGAPPAFGTDTATRMYQYELALGTRFGQTAIEMPWNFQVIGILRGPMWYNTEEALNPLLYPGQIRSSTVYRKEPFWVLNMRGELEVRKGFTVFAAMNNIFDVNAHPIFIGIDNTQCGDNYSLQNGACGNSMPGREVIVGGRVQF
ncbi:MAG TPA: TonB-dependent receptor [Reyranella sp.]